MKPRRAEVGDGKGRNCWLQRSTKGTGDGNDKNGLNFAVKPQVSEAHRKSTPKKGFAHLSYISRKTAPPTAPRSSQQRVQWSRARLTKPRLAPGQTSQTSHRAGAGQGGGEGSPRHRHRTGDTLPMFPSMEIFLMRLPSELVEGERQNLLGGVAMPSSRRLGRGTCRNTAVRVARGSVNLAPAGPAL